MILLTIQSNNTKSQKGFTLVELIVVISVMGVLSFLGVAGLYEYSKVQTLQNAAKDVVSVLNLAKSRALSQVRPSVSICAASGVLNGYLVILASSGGGPINIYRLRINCGGIIRTILTRTLPKNIVFTQNQSFFFPILTGGATAGTIVIQGYGGSIPNKTIIIDARGVIKIQ
ncbi:MAG: prepilin-type N-terminal cleavage/methylation domain-containing protein [Patescibacteria group bacterium]